MSNKIHENFKENLSFVLKRQGIKQEELAKKMCMDKSTLSNKLNGNRPFYEEYYDEICDILKVERSYMEQRSEMNKVTSLINDLLNQNNGIEDLRLIYTKQIIDCNSEKDCTKVFTNWNKEHQISELVINHPSGVAIIAVILGIGAVLSLSQNIILQSVASLVLTSLGVFLCSSFSCDKITEKIASIIIKTMFVIDVSIN